MSLQFIIGSSGIGKTHYACQHIIQESLENPQCLYYIIVPEQFTMQTQKNVVEMHPGKGILNIDVLSFERLAYRIFEEVGGAQEVLLDDTGKSMVLQKLVQQHRKNLPYLGSQMNKPGYLDEVKSLLSEFMQYDIHEEDLETMLEKTGPESLLHMKMQDVGVLYQAFLGYLEGHYMTGEGVMDALKKAIPFSNKLRNAVLLLDGFTGFTPVQMNVIQELLAVCSKVLVTVTMDAAQNYSQMGKPHQLFYMSRKMLHTLSGLTNDLDEPVLLKEDEHGRFQNSPALGFLEKHLFRYQRASYEKKQDGIRIFAAESSIKELEETARRIRRMVREKGLKYGEIAVITGNLEAYKSIASQVFEESQIPYFLDEKHTILMNPFVEYIRAALEMVTKGFSYESVFRYLRCGLSGITREEADMLENYVLALGIRGYEKWSGKWIRTYRTMKEEDIQLLNEYRERFVNETEILAQGFSGGKKKVCEYCYSLYQFITGCEIQKKLKEQELLFQKKGEKALEKEYAQIYGIVMELLDRMVEILGEEELTRTEFVQLLETGFAKSKVALIPPSMDQVLIGDMERTRLKEIKALFFVGVNEGNIPKNTDSGGMLTQMDREFFAEEGMELAPGPKELMNTQRFYLYLNLTKPSEYLCLSYCFSNGKGEPLSPAYLIHTIQGLYPQLEVENAADQEFTLDSMEIPGNSLECFLKGLADGALGKGDPLYSELYSWYLRSPKYRTVARKLVEASRTRKPADIISESVAKVLYGEVSPYSATRLERYSACAFAHFLQYGLKLTERAEYEFRAMDMGNIMHKVLEKLFQELNKEKLSLAGLTDEQRDEMADILVEQVSADYGNTILKSSARNEYMIQRTKRMVRRTVWAIQEQLKGGEFQPEGVEVVFQGGRIDRVDTMETEDGKLYVKVIDYKTGNTSFDLVSLYHGLQLQLMIYMDGALTVEKNKHRDKEVIPAGVFYYNIKDPMIKEKMDADVEAVQQKVLKELKMNGLVQADRDLVEKMDSSLVSLPVSFNKDGSFRKNSSVATREQFDILNRYVKNKISHIRKSIMSGDAQVAPYMLGKKNACTYCPYSGVCGFDMEIPGYEFRRLKNFADEELWNAFAKEVE
ncbi:helicase-exonuclease AddAB subunit AddB [Blautia sp.]